MHIRNEGDRVVVMAMVRVLSGRREKSAAKKEIAAAICASVYVLERYYAAELALLKPTQPNEVDAEIVRRAVAMGFTKARIAEFMGLSVSALRRCYSAELSGGYAQ